VHLLLEDLRDALSLDRAVRRSPLGYVFGLTARSLPETRLEVPLETYNTNIQGAERGDKFTESIFVKEDRADRAKLDPAEGGQARFAAPLGGCARYWARLLHDSDLNPMTSACYNIGGRVFARCARCISPCRPSRTSASRCTLSGFVPPMPICWTIAVRKSGRRWIF
jgi:hypothetical protein